MNELTTEELWLTGFGDKPDHISKIRWEEFKTDLRARAVKHDESMKDPEYAEKFNAMLELISKPCKPPFPGEFFTPMDHEDDIIWTGKLPTAATMLK